MDLIAARPADRFAAPLPALLKLAVPVCFGLATLGIVAAAGDPAANLEDLTRLGVIAVAVLLTLIVGVLTRQFTRTMIFAWVLSQSYFRTLSLTGEPVPLTAYTAYWTVSDVFLILLAAIAIRDAAFLKIKRKPYGPALWFWLVPFLTMVLISMSNAERFDWASFEVFRLLKLLLGLILLRYLIRAPFDWWLTVTALAASACLQALDGVFQLVTHTAVVLEGESSPRAMGSMGHPNTYSSYLALIWPICGMLAIAPGPRTRRLTAAAASCLILIGIAIAQSRAIWFIATVQVALLAVGATGLRLISVKRGLGLIVTLLVAGLLALAPLATRIENRLLSNWDESAEFRNKFDALALRMAAERPWIGGGPRQFPLRFAPHMWELYGRLEDKIPPFPVHNFYLLELVEYGALGLGAFLVFVGAIFVYGARCLRSPSPIMRAMAYGLCVGILGSLVHQLSELVLILDPNMYTFGILVSLLSALPVCAESAPPQPVQAVSV